MPINVNLPARNKIVINETTYMLMLPRIRLFRFVSFLVGGGGVVFSPHGFHMVSYLHSNFCSNQFLANTMNTNSDMVVRIITSLKLQLDDRLPNNYHFLESRCYL
jgi:hypothetical protein